MPSHDHSHIGTVIFVLLNLAMFAALFRRVWLPLWRAFRAI